MGERTHDDLPVVIREGLRADLDLTYASWVQSLAHMRPWSHLDPAYHAASSHALMARILAREGTQMIAAQDPRFEDQIYGVIVTDGGRGLYWLYVRKPFRKAHVATRLVGAAFSGDATTPIRCAVRTAAHRYHADRWRLEVDPSMLVGESLQEG